MKRTVRFLSSVSVALVAVLLSGCHKSAESIAEASPAASVAVGVNAAKAAPAAGEQYFPLQSYRVGPYAAGGTGFFGGFIDYMNLINLRDGGVNGVKLTWSECETEYVVERGVECYERLKKGLNGAPAAATASPDGQVPLPGMRVCLRRAGGTPPRGLPAGNRNR